MLRNILMLVSASIGAQLIAVMFLPILSRLYDDEAFGIFQIYFVTFNMCMVFVSLRYDNALLVADTEYRFRTLLRLIVRLCAAASVAIGLAALIIWPWVAGRYLAFSEIVVLLPIAMAVGGLLQTLTLVVTHERRYGVSASMKFAQTIGYVGSGIAFAFGPVAFVGLILADMVGRAASAGLILIRIRGLWARLWGPLDWAQARLVAWRYRDYPSFTLPSSMMSASIELLMSIVFLRLFDLAVAGQYALVERFILLPVGLIAGAAAQVFTGDFAERVRTRAGPTNAKFRATVLVLTALALGPAVVLYLTAPALVPFVFGEQWQLAGQLCQIAVPIAVVRFVAGPMMMVLVVCGRQRLMLAWTSLRFVLTLGLFAILLAFGANDPLDVMRYYVLSIVLAYAVYLIIADRVTVQLDHNL